MDFTLNSNGNNYSEYNYNYYSDNHCSNNNVTSSLFYSNTPEINNTNYECPQDYNNLVQNHYADLNGDYYYENNQVATSNYNNTQQFDQFVYDHHYLANNSSNLNRKVSISEPSRYSLNNNIVNSNNNYDQKAGLTGNANNGLETKLKPTPTKNLLLPTNNNSTVYTNNKRHSNNINIGKKQRVRADAHQASILESVFNSNTSPNLELRQILARKTNMSEKSIQIWFQNRRAKVKLMQKRNHVFHEQYVKHNRLMRSKLGLNNESTINSKDSNLVPYQINSDEVEYDKTNCKRNQPENSVVDGNFPIQSLLVGDFKRKYNGNELKCSYNLVERVFQWQIVDNSQLFVIEINMDTIQNICFEFNVNNDSKLGQLSIDINQIPKFYIQKATSNKHSELVQCIDFTENQQCSKYFKHKLVGDCLDLATKFMDLCNKDIHLSTISNIKQVESYIANSNFDINDNMAFVEPRRVVSVNNIYKNNQTEDNGNIMNLNDCNNYCSLPKFIDNNPNIFSFKQNDQDSNKHPIATNSNNCTPDLFNTLSEFWTNNNTPMLDQSNLFNEFNYQNNTFKDNI